jgi:8-oxo-dGTP pyrophosphatase MutT (NUDIX family)
MFKNKQNIMIKDENGKAHWISRSVVVVCLVTWKDKFLIVRRGNDVIQTGKWCVPCGYLDYNESVEECAIREIFEESGIDIRQYPHELKLDYVNSSPDHTRNQDIGFHYTIEMNSDEEPKVDLNAVDSNETTDVKWIGLGELNDFIFAFNHDKKILKYGDK